MEKNFGYIEGYYGRLLSWDERDKILVAFRKLSLNTYVYGPKEDPFQRVQWKRPYPRQWNVRFSLFVKKAKSLGVRVVPSLAPGLTFDYKSASDYRLLVRKFTALIDRGAETIALFMDDIPEALPSNCKGDYSSLGQVHAILLKRLLTDLRKQNPHITLWFCPTVYCDQFAKGDVGKNRYLLDCAAGIPSDITVLWTGPSVISKKIDKNDIKAICSLFKGNLVIWDNLYANDYCPNRLFVGTYRGRSPSLISSTQGVCINPTGLVQTDIMLLSRLAHLVNGKRTSADQPEIPAEFRTVSGFFDSPFYRFAMSDFSLRKMKRWRKALRVLIWDWKTPLQCEWYPFLVMLDSDLALVERILGKKISTDWIAKKYPSVLSSVLIDCFAKKARRKA